ncbi:hypothetical protein ABTZ03_18845 [Kitasatospora sp. NPDC096077]|uniref:hypothetical protein n=1 Tax=Kitasatospora sp. NPDC096077 TaxID=3155544 RepID=UPI00332E4E25
MADLHWDDHVAWLLDPALDGWLPGDGVADTTVADWQALLDLVVERGWERTFVVGCFEMALPPAEEVLSWPDGPARPVLSVNPGPGVGAVFRFRRAGRIDLDVDVEQLGGQEGLDVLCGFLAAVGRRLGRAVPTPVEGGGPFLGYDLEADRVRVLWTPPEGVTPAR